MCTGSPALEGLTPHLHPGRSAADRPKLFTLRLGQHIFGSGTFCTERSDAFPLSGQLLS
jgi:hypothetical protein